MFSARKTLATSAVVLVITSAYLHYFLNRVDAAIERESLSAIPMHLQGWEGSDQNLPATIQEKLKMDEYIMRRYTQGSDVIWVYIGYYRNQKQDVVPHSPRYCYPATGFTPVSYNVLAIPTDNTGKRGIRANWYVFANGAEREVVIYWYQSRGRVIANDYMERLFLIRDSILHNRSDGALIRFSSRVTPGKEEESTRKMVGFISDFYSNILRVVPN
jgi:EpsI family protein